MLATSSVMDVELMLGTALVEVKLFRRRLLSILSRRGLIEYSLCLLYV